MKNLRGLRRSKKYYKIVNNNNSQSHTIMQHQQANIYHRAWVKINNVVKGQFEVRYMYNIE